MNIYLFELKGLRKSIVIWSLAISVSIMSYMVFFPALAADTAAFDAIMANYPPELLALFGMRAELPMTSLLGYFAVTFGIIQIPIAIQAANYGFNMLSVEERELTADFLLSKPVSRSKIFISKFLAALSALTIVNISIWIGSIASLLLFKGDAVLELNNVYVLLSTIILFQLVFMSVGILVSLLVRKVPSVLSFSMALAFGMYIIYGFKAVFSVGILSYVTPYSYFDVAEILINGTYEVLETVIAVVVIIVSLTMSYFLYKKRNIHSL